MVVLCCGGLLICNGRCRAGCGVARRRRLQLGSVGNVARDGSDGRRDDSFCVCLHPHVVRCDAIVSILACLLSVVVDALVLRGLEDEAAGVSQASNALTYVPMLIGVVLVVRPVLRCAWVLNGNLCRPGDCSNPAATHITKRQREALPVLVQLACAGAQANDRRKRVTAVVDDLTI